MPELPEVETIRRQLAPRLLDCTLTEAWGDTNRKFTSAPLATGSRIVAVRRRGKYLIMDLHDERELIVHLGMTGRLSVGEHPGLGDTSPHLRAWWQLDSGDVLALTDIRQFGRVAVVDAGDHATLPTLATLGPEPLSDEFTAQHLWEAVRKSKVRIKTQLLSQRPVAGVGNIYADEALWIAGIHPADRRLSAKRAVSLRDAVRETLSSALSFGGTTLRNYVDAEGAEGSNQYELFCYGRAGSPCQRCGTELRSRELDGRTTTWCPECQPPRR